MKIDGQTALIAGAGSGLGEATARDLAARGARVIVLDRDRAAAERVARAIDGRPAVADVADEEEVTAALDAAGDDAVVRIVVNCAGIADAARIIGRDGPAPLHDFERVVRVNLIGTFNVMRLAATRMADAPALHNDERGVIVNTASIAAFDGQIGQCAYAASKGAVAALALPAARELARAGIRVNTVAPGVFATPLVTALPQEVIDGISASVPFPKRMGDPDEFAATIRHCIETQYLNAALIRLDGGVRLPPK